MQNQIAEQNSTQAFYVMAWLAFGVSGIGVAAGIANFSLSWAERGFLVMSYLFSVVSCFTLAKVVRDKHEQTLVHKQVQRAKTEQLLSKYADPDA